MTMGRNTAIDNKSTKPSNKHSDTNTNKENDNKNESITTESSKEQKSSNGTITITPTSTATRSARVDCPCHNYTALSKIVDVLSSEDRNRTDLMIDWLNGSTDRIAIREKKLLTCGKRFQCRFRYGTSFAILRAIRDACAPFLASTTGNGKYAGSLQENTSKNSSVPSKIKVSNRKEIMAPSSYDESFPPLQHHPGFSNILTPPSGKKTQSESNISVAASTIRINADNKLHTIAAATSTATTVNTLQGRKKKPKRRVQLQQTQPSTSTLNPDFPNSALNVAAISIDQNLKTTEKKDIKQSIPNDSPVTVVNTLHPRKKSSKQLNQPQHLQTGTGALNSSFRNVALENSAYTTNSKSRSDVFEGENPLQSTANSKTNDTIKTPAKPSSDVCEGSIEQMDRLVDIYVALIENMLVPSTPLEIHLLLELLSIDTETISTREHSERHFSNQSIDSKGTKGTTASTGLNLFFQPVFYSPERCIHFAKSVLNKLEKGILQRLSPFLIKSLLRNIVFERRCPVLAQNLNRFLLETTTAADWTPQSPESVTGTHAIFSLPFEPDRDSRHNFKTQAEISMYGNREVTRDAFLSGLRVFMTAKSKVFLPQQVDKVRETARYESKKIIGNVLSHNMMWFAQFFCELLLQVGLAPVEEMDQELLQIVADDRDKLQKLHKRFFKKNPSRASQTRAGLGSASTTMNRRNERYRNHSDRNNKDHHKPSVTSSCQEALAYFPGYQEFFFIFLYSVDSYDFGMHLLHQLAKKTSDMVSNRALSGLEKRVLDLGLIARFLGFLIFSPNWHEESIDLNKLKPFVYSLDHGLNLLESIGLPLSKLVEESWNGGYTFLVIPWVTELLKMSKWDSISQSSMSYRQILANLRFVQRSNVRPSPEENLVCGSNIQLVSFHLETFFNETFSLPKLTSLPNATLVRPSPADSESLDSQKVGFSTAAIYASSSHMEDLCDMIMNLSKNSIRREMKSPSIKPRKLKPSIVSTTIGTETQSYLGIESPKGKSVPTLSDRTWKVSSLDSPFHEKQVHAQHKLTDGFFHQHRDLKEICDFVIEQTLKTVTVGEMSVFVMKAVEECSIGIEPTETEIEEMEMKAFELSSNYLRDKLANRLTQSLEMFCHSGTHQRVIEVATNLSTVRGMESSGVILRGLISSSTKIVLKRSKNKTKSPKSNSEETKSDIDFAIEAATASIGVLKNKFSPLLVDSYSNIRLVEDAIGHVKFVTKSVMIPRENLLREFFDCILSLDPIAESVIDQVIRFRASESWVMLFAFFRLLEQLALMSGYWRSRISSLFGENLMHLISNCKSPSSSEKKIMLERLMQLSKK